MKFFKIAIQADLKTYNDCVEKELYRQLMEERKKQEEILLAIQLCHNTISNEVFNFNEICNFAGMGQYTRNINNLSFHNNLFMPHRSFPEYGSPLLNCANLPAVENVIMRDRAKANFMFNDYRERKGLEQEQLPQAKKFKDIDLQKFLDEIEA